MDSGINITGTVVLTVLCLCVIAYCAVFSLFGKAKLNCVTMNQHKLCFVRYFIS